MAHVEPPPSDHPPENPPENNSPSGSQNPSTKGDGFPTHKHAKVMENTIAFVLKCAAENSPTKTLTPKQKALIDQRLLNSFPVFHRPDHPPYAAMIEAALEKLNQKDGSSEKAISNFIKKEYVDLPWAHDIFLKHHLDNLCKEGRIFKTRRGLYMSSAKVSNDVDPLSPGSPIGTDSDFSADLNPSSSSHYDTDCSVSQIPARNRKRQNSKLLKRRMRSKKGSMKGKKHTRAKNEKGHFLKWQTEEDVVDDEMTLGAYTSMVNRRIEGNGEQNQTENEFNRLNEVSRFRAKRQNTKKLCPGELASQISSYGHEDMVNELNGQKMQGNGTGRESRDNSQVEVDCHAGANAKQSLSLPMQHEVASTLQLSLEAGTQEEQHNMIEVTGPKENLLKETHFQVVEEANQMQVQNAVPVGEKCVVQKKRGRPHNGSRKGQEVPNIEETEPLPEHNLEPVGEQCCMEKKRGRPPNGSKKGQKASVKHVCIPGKGRSRPRENESLVDKTNAEQTELTRVLDSETLELSKILEKKCQIDKNLQVDGQAEDTPDKGKRGETKTVMLSGKREHDIEKTEARKNGNNSSSVAQGSTRGKGMEQPPKKDFLAEATQQSSEQKKTEVFYTRKGKKRGVSDANYKKDLNVGVEGADDVSFHGQAGKTKTVMQPRKDGLVVEKNEPGQQLAVAARSERSKGGDIPIYHEQGNMFKTGSTQNKYSRKMRSNHVTSSHAL